jgi:tRNA (guanine-N7-)-methyltransferase
LAKIMSGLAAETENARVRREVVSFVRRSNRMRSNHRRAWEIYRDRFVLDVPRLQTSTSVHPEASLDLVAAFGRNAELIVEIGPGAGESLIPMAAARPEANMLVFEVYRPAIARMLGGLVRAGVENVRIVEADAVAGLERLLPAQSVDALWVFFPDPWPKPRHHKRRLLSPGFADLVASRLRLGGVWRIATDCADYAAWIRDVLDHDSRFAAEQNRLDWEARQITQFERRALDAGRQIVDLLYRRVD